MDIQISQTPQAIQIVIAGSINQTGAEELKRQLGKLNLEQIRQVVIDFADVTYIGSAGVGKLLLLYKNLPNDQAGIRLCNVGPEIYSLLMDMKLDEIFTIEKRR